MEKYICIHGHFYQPPRENPWLNAVEVQDSAYPFHDWNGRITEECYARNSASRILGNGKIIDIVNNYSRISFNFGPTLLNWMKKQTPEVYQAILNADKESQEYFSGHGSAMAQSYNHIIMPLANSRDQETQVYWGIKDFEARFGRKPEGMWLSETAVNTPVLEVMAKHGIKFTVLSPYQAKEVKKISEKEKDWKDVTGAKVDPRRPYLCKLPSGKTINLFFYDGPVSQSIAFEGLLNNGALFAERLMGTLDLDDEEDRPQMSHIATDGETYGHHHRHGEMALSFCLHSIEENPDVNLTIYGEYLEKYPPEYEARIIENTAWSSFPHLERWSTDGGGHTGMNPGWHQRWRAPLRTAFDWLRERLIPIYEKEMKNFTDEPWQVRDHYYQIIMDRSPENVRKFIDRNTKGELSQADKIKFLKLLEIQHHAMLMYTSCGWFFDEVTGIETIQDILYAARAIQLTKDVIGINLEPNFLKLLEKAPSNIPEHGNAALAYEKFVRPSIVDMLRVGAHYAVSSLFSEYPEITKIYSFTVKSYVHEPFVAGKYRLVVGRATLVSEVTWEENDVTYAILHLGDQHLFGGVREYENEFNFHNMREEIVSTFQKSRVHEAIVLMDKHFGTHNYSFWHLFKDDQKKVLNQVLAQTLTEIEGTFKKVYEENYSILQAIKDLNSPTPEPLRYAATFFINSKIRSMLESPEIDLKELDDVIQQVHRFSVEIDSVTLNFLVTERLNTMMRNLESDPDNIPLIENMVKFLQEIRKIPLTPDFWHAQNTAFLLSKKMMKGRVEKCANDDVAAKVWVTQFKALLDCLGLEIQEEVNAVLQ